MSRILFVAKHSRITLRIHEQTIIFRQLFAGHVVGFRSMKRKRKMHLMINMFIYNIIFPIFSDPLFSGSAENVEALLAAHSVEVFFKGKTSVHTHETPSVFS